MTRRLPTLLLLSLLTGCAAGRLEDPEGALTRMEGLEAAGRDQEAAELAKRMIESPDVPASDRAEAAFQGGELEMALGRHARAFELYRYVLENAPWSKHFTTIEQRLYEIGQTMLFDESYGGFFDDRGRGVDALETLIAHYRSSERADDALKLIGDYFSGPEVDEQAEAALAYLRVADEYPESEWAERCLWLAGHCRLQLAGGPQYDRNDLLRARELLARSLASHPRGVAVREARADLDHALELLAEAELVVADFYARRGVVLGEQLRLANAALVYPDTQAGRWAAERLAAAGVDLQALRADPSRNSVDKVAPIVPLWEQQRDQRGRGGRW